MNTLIVQIAEDKVNPGTEFYDFYIGVKSIYSELDAIVLCLAKLKEWHAGKSPLFGFMTPLSVDGSSRLFPSMLGPNLGPTKISTLYRLALIEDEVIKKQRLITQEEFEQALAFKVV